jgi:hypothetical protein
MANDILEKVTRVQTYLKKTICVRDYARRQEFAGPERGRDRHRNACRDGAWRRTRYTARRCTYSRKQRLVADSTGPQGHGCAANAPAQVKAYLAKTSSVSILGPRVGARFLGPPQSVLDALILNRPRQIYGPHRVAKATCETCNRYSGDARRLPLRMS